MPGQSATHAADADTDHIEPAQTQRDLPGSCVAMMNHIAAVTGASLVLQGVLLPASGGFEATHGVVLTFGS